MSRDLKPIPGDPDVIEARAATYLGVADAIRTANQKLTRVADLSDMSSEAINAVREDASKVAESIDNAEVRYRGTAEALAEYAPLLRQYQADADKAILDAAGAAEAADNQRARQDEYAQKAATPGPDQASDQKWADFFRDQAETKDASAASAQAAYDTAYENWKAAADAARSKIDAAIDESKLNNTFWDAVVDIAKIVGEVAGLLALFFSWVPIIGQILVAIAILSSLVAVIDAIVNLVNGTGTWGDLAFAVVGLVLAVVAPGIMKIIGKAMKSANLVKPLASMNKKAFKAMTGVSKKKAGAIAKQQNISWKDAFTSTFKPLSKSHFTPSGFASQAKTNLAEFRANPLGLKSPDIYADMVRNGGAVPKTLTVSLAVMEYRGVASKIEALSSNPFDPNDQKATLKPETILQQATKGEAPVLVPAR
jgi:hypothetical protein